MYWAQKARLRSAKEGDRNTSYFHACMAIRRKQNRITKIQKSQGGWCNTNVEIGNEVAEFYSQLFTSSQPNEFEEILKGIHRSIMDQINLQLTQPAKEKQIKEALFSMHPNKALGPDGMSPHVFKNFGILFVLM